MRQRLLKYLKRFLVVLLVLGIVLVGVFTWLCYWPFEGDVDDILTIVPEDVDFVLRADYADLKATGWVQQNVFEDPLIPALGEDANRALEQIELEIQGIQAQVDSQAPIKVDIADFIEGHILKGEVCIAGNFWEHALPREGPPKWKDLLVLKRVSRIARCVSGLQHGFIRDQLQLGPGVSLSAEGQGIFAFTLHAMKRPVVRRAGGPALPDMSVWYLARVQGVLAVSNSRKLVEEVVKLGESQDGAGSFARRHGFDIPQTPGRITAAVSLDPLNTYIKRTFDYFPALKTIRRFLPPDALVKMSGGLSIEGTDILSGGAKVNYAALGSESEDVVRNVYSLPQRPLSRGIAELVPAEDTFAVVSIRSNPEYLLNAVVTDMLDPGDRRLWEQNLQKEGGFASLEEFFEDLSTRMGNEAMVAVARMSDVYDKIDFEEWWSDEPAPIPALAIMVRIGAGASQKELQEYIASKVFLLGLKKELETVTYGNFTYSRGTWVQKTLDLKYVTPCFTVVSNHFVMTDSEAYMRKILDTVRDRERNAIAQDETYRQTMAALPAEGHVGIFLDLEKLFRVPDSMTLDPNNPENNDLGAPGTRGFMWDKRNQWVIVERDDRAEAMRFEREVKQRYPKPLNGQQQRAIEKEVDAYMEGWLDRYPEFLEEYRRSLTTYQRLRGIGVVLGASGETIDTHFALTLKRDER